MIHEPWSATFVVPIDRASTEAVIDTCESVLRFRQYAYRNVERCHIMCVGEISDVDRLRDYAVRRRFCPGAEDMNFNGVYPTTDWPEIERDGLAYTPKYALYLNAAAGRILRRVVVLLPPGKLIRDKDPLVHAIQKVATDGKLLVVSMAENATAPASAAFNWTGYLNLHGRRPLAMSGVPSFARRKLFGGFKFVKADHDVELDASWLIAAIGLEYAESASGQISFADWV